MSFEISIKVTKINYMLKEKALSILKSISFSKNPSSEDG
jgi:hypothetical protein